MTLANRYPSSPNESLPAQLSESVCTILQIDPFGTNLIALLDGKSKTTNQKAISDWCEAQLLFIDSLNCSPSALAQMLASQLNSHLTNLMH